MNRRAFLSFLVATPIVSAIPRPLLAAQSAGFGLSEYFDRMRLVEREYIIEEVYKEALDGNLIAAIYWFRNSKRFHEPGTSLPVSCTKEYRLIERLRLRVQNNFLGVHHGHES